MSTVLAAGIAVAAITATYFFCVRPHLRVHGCHASGAQKTANTATGGAPASEQDRQIAQLREELRMLRAQDRLDAGQLAGGTRIPPHGQE